MKNYIDEIKKLKNQALAIKKEVSLEDIRDLTLRFSKLALDKFHRNLKK